MGVFAEFEIFPDQRGILPTKSFAKAEFENRKNLLEEALGIVDDGATRAARDTKFFLLALLLLIFVYFFTIDIELKEYRLALVMVGMRFLVALMIGFCFVNGVILLKLEQKALKAAKSGMQILIKNSNEEKF